MSLFSNKKITLPHFILLNIYSPHFLESGNLKLKYSEKYLLQIHVKNTQKK